ncbi:hypothetical protein RclHR1_07930005 [Rhizophagus clarus]|uniref:PARP catalytic domain-containing protein n=1 Tax=Rhizophagus clarus TaxID=94130 RepID=A0A2Z6RYF6_9GLOM|nr:hypothetical protein RclHR1_07930005 [Rhizophagus clarus]GES97078.1 hypothetical protein RCL_jg5139.t1 [Rhizophagus clarus]
MPKCLYCSVREPDLDPNGSLSEYCSDECRISASNTGFTTPCIQCEEFPRLKSSQYCGWERCRKADKCITCKVNYITITNSLWCSRQCRDITHNWRSMVKTSELCLKCTKENTYFGKNFCEICEEWVNENGPCIFKLSKQGNKFKDISNQFISSWKHKKKAIPEIHTIYKIFPNEQIISRYNNYRDSIESLRRLEGRPFPKGNGRVMTKGNEQRRFHGTRMKCLLGIETDTLCSDMTCAVCRIITEGYKLMYAKTSRFKYQRFGDGIYFSSTSSKSDDFNRESLKNHNGVNYKVMFLNKVVVGRAFELIQEVRNLKGPPINYDSVVGEPSASLYYDELVVYNESACIPQYLIVYEN